MYKILGTYRGSTEEIDSFDTRTEALKMLTEYKLAYGIKWTLKIRRVR